MLLFFEFQLALQVLVMVVIAAAVAVVGGLVFRRNRKDQQQRLKDTPTNNKPAAIAIEMPAMAMAPNPLHSRGDNTVVDTAVDTVGDTTSSSYSTLGGPSKALDKPVVPLTLQEAHFSSAAAAPPEERKHRNRRVQRKHRSVQQDVQQGVQREVVNTVVKTKMGPGTLLYERKEDGCRVYALAWQLAGGSKAMLYEIPQ